MRSFIKSFSLVGILIISIFIINGCYTQFAAPKVDTYDEYYVIEEEEDQYYDEYQEQDTNYYEEGWADSTVVNYNYYDVHNYNYPNTRFYDPWYSYGYSYYYSPYDMYYYSGYYPEYWWDPFYQVYMPGWWVSYWSYGHYWHRYPRYYHHYGGRYYVTPTSPKQKREFSRRSSDPFDMKQKRSPNSGVTSVSKQGTKDLDRPRALIDKDEIVNRKVIPRSDERNINKKSKPVVDKRKIGTISDESKSKRIIGRKPVSDQSGRKIVKPVPVKSSETSSKPKVKESKYSQPRKIYIPSNKIKRVVRPRPSEQGAVNKPSPKVKRPDGNSKPAVRRMVKPPSSGESRPKSSVRRSQPTSRPTMSRPSTPSIKRSSTPRPSVKSSSGSSGSKSSNSSGSKSSSKKK